MYTRETQELIYAILGDISNFFTGQEAGSSPHRLDLEQTKKQIKERFLEEYDLKPLEGGRVVSAVINSTSIQSVSSFTFRFERLER